MRKTVVALILAGVAASCISFDTYAADMQNGAADPGHDWRIALHNARQKGSPDQNQDTHLTAQEKAEVENREREKMDTDTTHPEGHDWRIALKNAEH